MIRIIKNIALHLFFWGISLFLFAFAFRLEQDLTKIDLIFSSLFHLGIIPGVYINLFLFIPFLFNRKKYLLFTFGLCALFALLFYFHQFTFNVLADNIFKGYFFVTVFEWNVTVILVILYLLITTLLKMSQSWFLLQEKEFKLAKVEKEHAESQLAGLMSQINPHFLFNSLNVIYALALKKSDDNAEAVLKLSDILRYVIYDINNTEIKVSDEVKLIGDYLDLNQYRIEDFSKIHFIHSVKFEQKIAPMLLLPLIENAFKHGIKADTKDNYLNINLDTTKNYFIFQIENSISTDRIKKKNEQGGIGLENIQKRLKMLYPNCHSFTIEETDKLFKVRLKIDYND